jgi:uncharacterized protein (TIGR00299 family) protein
MSRVGWLDLSCGASGDMLLGALVGAGVPLQVPADAVAALGLPISLTAEPVTRAALAATSVSVRADEQNPPHRGLTEILELLDRLGDGPVRQRATAVFECLARAEAAVHAVDVNDVHFHEVGALDAIADVVGVVAGFQHLALDALAASPIALGSGSVATRHGRLPVPTPAVLEIARSVGLPVAASDVSAELCTPTGAALVATLVQEFTVLPSMRPATVGVGAGGRNLPDRPNVVRLVVGERDDTPATEAAVVLETNVDDLDPRAWPSVLAALLQAGADDAWLAPIMMKKGRPAHTLRALASPNRVAAVRRTIFNQTTTLGLRELPVTKHTLAREFAKVQVEGAAVTVKVARDADGRVLNVQPEWEDVAALAELLGQPVKAVLAQAQTAAAELLEG